MKLEEQIKQKTEQLEKLGREINTFQKALQEKQIEALKLDGAISALKELQNENTKDTPKK